MTTQQSIYCVSELLNLIALRKAECTVPAPEVSRDERNLILDGLGEAFGGGEDRTVNHKNLSQDDVI